MQNGHTAPPIQHFYRHHRLLPFNLLRIKGHKWHQQQYILKFGLLDMLESQMTEH